VAASACGFSALDGLSGGPGDASHVAPEASVDGSDGASRVDVLAGSEGSDGDGALPGVAMPEAMPGCDGGCSGNGYCAGTECVYPSCIARLLSLPSSPSGVYLVDPDGRGGEAPFRAFCEMVLDGGGWTLLLKVDGTKPTFLNDSPLWENGETLEPQSADLDRTEAKLAGFASMPFVYLRVGMLQNEAVHWLILPLAAESLRGLMTSGYHATNVGRSAWERLPSRGSLQLNCNREGINVATPEASVRIGIVANNQNDCSTCNSWIGFGAEGETTGERACGNVAATATDNGQRDDALFGYVMVR
jgi:hypothetical protein